MSSFNSTVQCKGDRVIDKISFGNMLRDAWYNDNTQTHTDIAGCLPFYRKIQEETLRTYIFTYGDVYDTLRCVCVRVCVCMCTCVRACMHCC